MGWERCSDCDGGWTLNYEVCFCLLFAAALALDLSPMVFLTPCLTGLALLGMVRPATWPDFTSLASPVVLEFLFGVILAHFAARRKLPGKSCAVLLLGGGFLVLMLMPEAPRPGISGLGTAGRRDCGRRGGTRGQLGGRLPKWLLEAGNASYAL